MKILKIPKRTVMSRPVLNSRFFSEQTPTREFFQKWKNAGSWSALMMPLYEWDGILYVGINHAQTPSITMNHVLIEADSNELSHLWEKWTTAPVAESEFELQDTPEQSPEGEVTPIPQAQPEIPEGLENFSPQENNSKNSSSENDDHFASLENSTVQSTVQRDQDEFDPSLKAAVSEFIAKATTQAPEESVLDKNWSNEVFDKINAHFQKTMIFIVYSEAAKPWKWNDGFTFLNNKIESIDLKLQSPFRVVFRTNKSFHGKVAPNEVVEKFAQFWAKGQTPTQLTIAPILIVDNLYGMILGESNSESLEHSHLLMLEKSASEIANYLKSNSEISKTTKSAS